MFNKLINVIKTILLNRFAKKDIDYNTWIFSSSYNEKFNYNSKYLFEYVLKHEPKIKPIFVINDDDHRNALQTRYGKKYFIETKSNKGIMKVLNSGVWFTSAGMPVYGLNLNKERIIINLWHGVPLKKIALQENNFNKVNKVYFKHIFSYNYTYILTTSKNIAPLMQKSFDVPGDKIKIWGQPRNDAIFNKNNKHKILNNIYGTLPTFNEAILYAPTYRGYKKTRFFPFKDYDIKKLNIFLEKNKLIVFIRCHQSETKTINNTHSDRVKLINSDVMEEITDIINIFDLLITDYSSIYIDYLLIERPIIFLPYDKEEYIKARGFNFNYDDVTPGPKPKTFIEFKNEIYRLLNNKNYYNEDRIKVNKFFNEITDKCSPAIVSSIKENIKIRQGENYYEKSNHLRNF